MTYERSVASVTLTEVPHEFTIPVYESESVAGMLSEAVVYGITLYPVYVKTPGDAQLWGLLKKAGTY